MKLNADQIQDIELSAGIDVVVEVRTTVRGVLITRRPARERHIQFPHPVLCADRPTTLTLTVSGGYGGGGPVHLGDFGLPANYWVHSILGYTKDPEPIPKTVKEALAVMEKNLSPEDRETLKKIKVKKDLYVFHHGVGTAIRNAFGMWEENTDLLDDCKKFADNTLGRKGELHGQYLHPDDASMVLLVQLWRKLKEEET